MKGKLVIFLVLFSIGVLFASDNTLEYLNVTSDGKNITIEWKSYDESSITRYEIERQQSSNPFKFISSQDAKGTGYIYRFIDENAYLKTGSDQIAALTSGSYNYRLKIVNKSGSYSYSDNKMVVHDVSGIRRTWGMIKEMFR
jgi:hypothetical protein